MSELRKSSYKQKKKKRRPQRGFHVSSAFLPSSPKRPSAPPLRTVWCVRSSVTGATLYTARPCGSACSRIRLGCTCACADFSLAQSFSWLKKKSPRTCLKRPFLPAGHRATSRKVPLLLTLLLHRHRNLSQRFVPFFCLHKICAPPQNLFAILSSFECLHPLARACGTPSYRPRRCLPHTNLVFVLVRDLLSCTFSL